jgi:anti-sigma regulatory factor (Ser/Thr protein kinase)
LDPLHLHFDIDGSDFTAAGEASGEVKRVLRKLGFDSEIIRRCAICMYEGEINMVIHASGGTADVFIESSRIAMELKDSGPGIADVGLAMQEGYSTASQDIRELGFGAGMGLPNMKRYSDELRIDTEVGVGTSIYLAVNLDEKRGSL